MSISRVITVRVLPGRLDDFIERLGEGKRIRESVGIRRGPQEVNPARIL